MRAVAAGLFLGGLLLWIRVMFFGVQRRIDAERVDHRRWPLALAALFVTVGAMLYGRPVVTSGWLVIVALTGCGAGMAAWWIVKRSAAIPSTDPDDDPRFRYQGHVARLIRAIESREGAPPMGRIAFTFDGKPHELDAIWSPEEGAVQPPSGHLEDEVVIERVEGGVAYVEPWTVVEERL